MKLIENLSGNRLLLSISMLIRHFIAVNAEFGRKVVYVCEVDAMD